MRRSHGGTRSFCFVPTALLALTALLAVSTKATPAAARAEELSARVEARLSLGFEAHDLEASILALGEEGERALIAVFERPQAARYVRLRALSALQAFVTPTSARYFAELVRSAATLPSPQLDELHPARSPLVLRRALTGLLNTAHLLSPRLSVADIAPCLAHASPHVRNVASRVLDALDDGGDGSVERVLMKQLARERSRMVRQSLELALTSRSAPP